MRTLDEWYKSAQRGTSGEMVWDILRDWKEQSAQEKLVLSRIEEAEYAMTAGNLSGEPVQVETVVGWMNYIRGGIV